MLQASRNKGRRGASASASQRQRQLTSPLSCKITVALCLTDVYVVVLCRNKGKPVWPSGKELGGKKRDLGSNPLPFLFKTSL